MTNAFGVVLDSASVRRAAVEGVPETVIAAIYLLHDTSVDEVVTKLTASELEQAIKLVGRCPSCYPPGTLEAPKGRRPAPAPQPSAANTPTNVAAARPAAWIKPGAEHIRQAKERRLASLRVHATQSAPEPERGVDPQKTGTRPGTIVETARRRLIVEDLMKAGLSVRMISGATDIPRSAVHRAMRAIARAEAKREVAIIEIGNELLGRRLSRGGRGRR
jgi:hypothetical protein